jgi:hypothetical protein
VKIPLALDGAIIPNVKPNCQKSVPKLERRVSTTEDSTLKHVSRRKEEEEEEKKKDKKGKETRCNRMKAGGVFIKDIGQSLQVFHWMVICSTKLLKD